MIDFFSSDDFVEPEKGDLLISEPYLPDPNFERTAVLLCEHDENGTVGFVLNKPAIVGLSDVMEDLVETNAKLFVGGPVQQDTLHFLHRRDDLSEEANLIHNQIYWGGNYERVASQLNTHQLDKGDIRFFIGYSGWSEGQLNNELKEKSWIVFKNPTSEMIFNTPVDELWSHVLKSMGGKFKLISNYPTDPRLN